MKPRSRRPGFGLMELMVALVIAATSVTAGAAMLLALADRTAAIRTAAERADARANGELVAYSLVAGLHAGTDDEAQFSGDSSEARFRTWCQSPRGWTTDCEVRISVVMTTAATSVVAEITSAVGADTAGVTLWTDVASASLIYLVHAAGSGEWTDGWSLPVLPLAIGLVLGQDTILLPVMAGV